MAAPEVPDWTRPVSVMGKDSEGNPVTVLLDSLGRLICVLYGAISLSGPVDVTQVDSTREIQGADGVTLHTIAVDSEGRIIAIVKGEYAGTLKNLAVDEQGRMIMIPTDPADIWGNAISMGNAELAVRLGSPGGLENSGQAILIDDFEAGKAKGLSAWAGTGASVEASSTIARYGGLSLNLTAGSDSSRLAEYDYVLPYPSLSRVGIQCSFTIDTYSEYFWLSLVLYDGTNLHRAWVRYNHIDKKVQYYSSGGVWTDLIADVSLYSEVDAFHWMKMVVDLTTNKYHRVKVDGWSWIAGDLSTYTAASALSPRFYAAICHNGALNRNPSINVDGVICTQNEPA